MDIRVQRLGAESSWATLIELRLNDSVWKVLVDLGADEQWQIHSETKTPTDDTPEVQYDVLLLSHHDRQHLGGLHAAVPNAAKYCTYPTRYLGAEVFKEQLELLDYVGQDQGRMQKALAVIRECTVVAWGERIFCGQLEGKSILISAIPAGFSIGGASWLIDIEGTIRLFLGHGMTTSGDWHIDGISLGPKYWALKRIDIAILPSGSRRILGELTYGNMFGQCVEHISRCLAKGGTVLVPTDLNGRLIELLLYFLAIWDSNTQLTLFPICFAAFRGKEYLQRMEGFVRWTSTSLQKAFFRSYIHPLHPLKSIKCISHVNEMPSGGSLIFATPLSLDNGLSKDIFMSIANGQSNAVLISNHTTFSGETVAAEVLSMSHARTLLLGNQNGQKEPARNVISPLTIDMVRKEHLPVAELHALYNKHKNEWLRKDTKSIEAQGSRNAKNSNAKKKIAQGNQGTSPLVHLWNSPQTWTLDNLKQKWQKEERNNATGESTTVGTEAPETKFETKKTEDDASHLPAWRRLLRRHLGGEPKCIVKTTTSIVPVLKIIAVPLAQQNLGWVGAQTLCQVISPQRLILLVSEDDRTNFAASVAAMGPTHRTVDCLAVGEFLNCRWKSETVTVHVDSKDFALVKARLRSVRLATTVEPSNDATSATYHRFASVGRVTAMVEKSSDDSVQRLSLKSPNGDWTQWLEDSESLPSNPHLPPKPQPTLFLNDVTTRNVLKEYKRKFLDAAAMAPHGPQVLLGRRAAVWQDVTDGERRWYLNGALHGDYFVAKRLLLDRFAALPHLHDS